MKKLLFSSIFLVFLTGSIPTVTFAYASKTDLQFKLFSLQEYKNGSDFCKKNYPQSACIPAMNNTKDNLFFSLIAGTRFGISVPSGMSAAVIGEAFVIFTVYDQDKIFVVGTYPAFENQGVICSASGINESCKAWN